MIRCVERVSRFAAEYVNVLARVDFRTAREIANLVADLYVKEEIDSVYIIFSEFKSVMVPTLAVEKLLPVEAIREDDTDKNGAGRRRKQKAGPTRLPSTTFMSSLKSKFWPSCCRAMWKRKFFAPCWNLPQRNMPRA